MKNLLILVIVIAVGVALFFHFSGKRLPGSNPAGSDGQPLVTCYNCNGAGVIKCPNPKCVKGYVDCPGECLKLSVGHWEHLDIQGADPSLLWRKFYANDGTWKAWSSNHVGEIIAIRDGVPVDLGKCQVCGGTGKIPCDVCFGTGTIICPVCKGRKLLTSGGSPAPSTASSPASSVSQSPAVYPETIKLKDGKTIVGIIIIADEDTSWIRTATGKVIQVPTKKIASHGTGQ